MALWSNSNLRAGSLPNHPGLFALRGYIERRRGHWEESTRNLERSIELDPRNFFTLQQIALSYGMLHRYTEEISVLERALRVEPNDVDSKGCHCSRQISFESRYPTITSDYRLYPSHESERAAECGK